MGLDMYLYRASKEEFKRIMDVLKQETAFEEKWDKLLDDLPIETDGYTFDEGEFNDDQKKLVEEYRRESELKREEFNSTHIEECLYWRKFNALHGYIVDNFANGVDECQIIEIGKDGVAKILSALKETLEIIKTKGMDSQKLPIRPRSGFFFGSTDVDGYFISNVKRAIRDFENLYKSLGDDEAVWYEASW